MHACGWFSAHGFGVLRCVTENLNEVRMLKVYKKGLLKLAEMLYCKNNYVWILQEDNVSVHRRIRLCTQRKQGKYIAALDWILLYLILRYLDAVYCGICEKLVTSCHQMCMAVIYYITRKIGAIIE